MPTASIATQSHTGLAAGSTGPKKLTERNLVRHQSNVGTGLAPGCFTDDVGTVRASTKTTLGPRTSASSPPGSSSSESAGDDPSSTAPSQKKPADIFKLLQRQKAAYKRQTKELVPVKMLTDDKYKHDELLCKCCGHKFNSESPLPPQPEYGEYYPWAHYYNGYCKKTAVVLYRYPKGTVCCFCRNTYETHGYGHNFPNLTLHRYIEALSTKGSPQEKLHPTFL